MNETGELGKNNLTFTDGSTTYVNIVATANQLTLNGATMVTPVLVSQIADPISAGDAANKNYVDNSSLGNLTGPISATGGVTSITSQTGSGTKFVVDNSPILITPDIGVAVGTSLSTSGFITTATQLISTVATGTSPFMVSSTTQVPNLKASRAATSDTVTTNANLTGPIASTGNITSIASQTGTGSTFVMNTSPVITNLNVGNTTITNVADPLLGTDATNKNYVESLTVISYTAVVQKNPGLGQFATIENALASITTSSDTERWVVEVGPGIYNENELVIPNYVSVKGSSIGPTVVSPNVPNQYLFIMGTVTEISFMTLQGISGSVSPGPGAGYAAVYCTDIENFAQMHKISIYDFDIGIDNYANATSSILYVEYTDVNGDFSYGLRNRSDAGFEAFVVLEDYFSYPSTSVTKTAVLNDGIGTVLQVTGSSLYGGPGMMGIVARNGGELLIGAATIKDFAGGGVISQNTGSGAVLKIDGTTFSDCVPDFSINNMGTTGYFFGNSPRNNHFIIDGSDFFIANQDNNVINVAKKGGDYTSIKTAVDSITDASPTNIYIVKIGPGTYNEDTITLSSGIFLIGTFLNGTTIVPNSLFTTTAIILADIAYVRDIYVTGAAIAMSFEGTNGLGTLVRDCAFGTNTRNIVVYGNTVPTLIVVDRCSILGNCTECIVVTNNPGIQTRITIDNIFYRDLVAPVTTNFFNASGVGVSVNVVSTLLLVVTVAGNKAFLLNDGVDFRITGSSITGFDNAIYVSPGSSSACSVNGSGTLLNNSGTYDIYIGSNNTIGSWTGDTSYTKVYIPDNCSFFISNSDATVVTVKKSGGNFASVVSALTAITDSSSLKRYVINIGAGTFIESEIVMKEFITIRGSGRSTIIQADAANHHIIRGCDFAELSDVILTGCGVGYAAIYQETASGASNTALICRGILFGVNDLHVWTYGNVGEAHIILFNSRYGGTAQFNKGFYATNSGGSIGSKITIIGTTSQGFTSPLPAYIGYASGDNCTVSVNGFNAINNDATEVNTCGFKADNGGFIRLISCTIRGFDTAVYTINSGITPQIVCSALTITDCNTDLNIDHPSTTGSIDASINRTKTIVNGSPPVSIFIVDPVNAGVAFSGPFYYSKESFNTLANISDLILHTPTLGLISGGDLTIDSGLTLAVSSGIGYNTNLSGLIIYQTWIGDTITLPINANSYICINSNGILSYSSSYPNSMNNILLGLVSTNATDIIYIQNTPLNSSHYANYSTTMFKNAIGPIYSSGSSVAEFGTRQLTVSQGLYYFTNNQFIPGGGSPVTFDAYYRSVTPGIFTVISSQTTVPNTDYDDGSGTLQPLTTSYYTKHLLLLLGGPSESYTLIYGQTEYISQGAAEAGGLPIVPSFVTDAFVRVASIIVQEGTTNIISFIDERPRIGFASSSTTGVITVHGDLLGLSANDHPQYLLVDGSAPGMTGDLDMNGNQIIEAGLINSVDITLHGSRHGLNSSDPLPTPTLNSDIADISGTTGSIGISNTLPRADHVHFHGNLSGGSLHAAVIAAGANGFMTGADKTKLDGIATGATNTTASNIAPTNVTKFTANAGVSAEVSRQDHKHDISTASPVTTLLTSTINAEGIAITVARSDHTHAISSDVPVLLTPDEAIAIGNSSAFARADHIHNIPTAIAAGINANSTSTQGAASSFSRSNHTHAIASGVPSVQTIAASVQTGTSTNFARADHIHTFSTDAPVTIAQANSEGVSTSFSRADHIHDHGNQTSPDDHTIATNIANGFMSNTDKTKLDTITLGGNLTFSGAFDFTGTLTNTTTVTFPTSGTLATTSQIPSVTPAALTKTDDTNVTLTLGGTPTTALLQTTSIAAGWTGTLSGARGGTGVVNVGKTITLGGSLTTSGAFDSIFTMTALTAVTFPTTGTLATTSQIPSVTPSALTKLDDTNVTLTLGGTPATALLQATSITAGWTGTLGLSRGGTATSLTANLGGIVYSDASALAVLSNPGSTGRFVRSQNAAVPIWSTYSMPASFVQGDIPYALTSTTIAGLTKDTNATRYLSNQGLLNAPSWNQIDLTNGITGILPSSNGGTGVNNGANTLILGGPLTTSGAFASTFTITAPTTITFPITGTLATTSQLPTPSALTKIDDTNITLTLDGTPATALLQATSITAGWIGTLSGTRGGTGVNNGASTLTLGGSLTTSGAFASTFTMGAATSVTFPPAGEIYAGTDTSNIALQTQATVAGTQYYITRSGLLVPGANIRVGTVFNWTVSMTKTAAGTNAFVIRIYMGTNGTTADTAIVAQSIGTQTAALDHVLLHVQVTFTAIGAGTGAVYWSMTPMNKAVSATGFGCVTGTLFSGTIGSLTTTTSGLILGLGFLGTTGTPTITLPMVQGQLLI